MTTEIPIFWAHSVLSPPLLLPPLDSPPRVSSLKFHEDTSGILASKISCVAPP